MPKSAQRQFLVDVDGIDGYFASKTGGETAAETSSVWDGGARRPEKLASPAETANLVIGRPFDPLRDRPVIRRLRAQVGAWRTTVSVQDTDASMAIVGSPTVYPQALLVRISEPDVDAASGDAAAFELEFAIEDVA